MKVCVTSYGKSLDSEVDPKFGRSAYFIVIDPETMQFEVIDNNSTQSAGGAGIQAGQLMSEKNVEALLTGNVGPNAFQVLDTAGIKIFTGVSGKINEVLAKYKNGELKAIDKATVQSHFGMQK